MTNSMDQSLLLEVSKQVLSQEIPHVMEPKGSLPYSYEPITSLI